MKSDLLANVSHELRTPLTAIKGYTDYILERKLGPITDKQEKGLVVVQRNLERLSKSINALLDFSRMDMGRIVLNIQPFACWGRWWTRSTPRCGRSWRRSGLDLRRPTSTPRLPSVIADREKLSAVLENLVINAIKFTPEGGRITVSAARGRGHGRGPRRRSASRTPASGSPTTRSAASSTASTRWTAPPPAASAASASASPS